MRRATAVGIREFGQVGLVFRTGLINMVLRGLTLGSKFLLLLVIARMLTSEELGIYGLMVVTITVSLYLLGFDFHAYNTREILAAERSEWPARMRDQIVFHGCIYIPVLPLLLVVFATDTIDWSYAVWFYILLVLEHLSQEAYRFLVTLSRSSVANLVLFLRSGLWVFAVAGTALLSPELTSLNLIFGAWLGGVIASLILAGVALRDLDWRHGLTAPVNWPWIRQGVRVSVRFFGATVCLLGMQYADRYFLKHFYGEEAVGIYTFFWQITNAVQIFVYTAVATVLYPRLVESYQKGAMSDYRSHMKRLVLGICATTVAGGIGVAVLIQPVLKLVGRDVYREYLDVGWILLAGMILLSLSYIPHLALYVRRLDRKILAAGLITLVGALAAHILLIPRFGPIGAAWGSLAAAGILLGVKSVFAIRRRAGERQEKILADVNRPARVMSVTLSHGFAAKEQVHE